MKKLPVGLTKEGFFVGKPVDLDSVEIIHRIITANFCKSDTINRSMPSKNLLYIVESITGMKISHGDFIAAMILADFTFVRSMYSDGNSWFNISGRSINRYRLKVATGDNKRRFKPKKKSWR